MIRFIFGVLLIVGAFILWKWTSSILKARKAREEKGVSTTGEEVDKVYTYFFQIMKKWVAGLLFVLGVFLFLSTSFVIVGQDEVGHLNKIFGFHSMPPDRLLHLKARRVLRREFFLPVFI